MRTSGVQGSSLAMALVGVLVFLAPVQAQNWRPALHDADELYDAAEDLRERAERFRDPRAIAVTGALECVSDDLYKHLKSRACAAEVLSLVNSTQSLLNETAAVVLANCDMHRDRKSLSELENAQHHFAATAEHVRCALAAVEGSSRSHPHTHAPQPATPNWMLPRPNGHSPHGQPYYGQPQYESQRYGQPQYSQPQYGQPPYDQPQYGPQHYGQPSGGELPYGQPPIGYEVRRPGNESTGRALARVLISEFLSR